MEFGLTHAGLGAVDDEWLIEAAASQGFQTVDLDPSGLIARHGAEGANALLRRHHIRVSAFGLPVEWRTTEEVFRDGLSKLTSTAAAAAAIGCTNCVTYILPSTDEPAAYFMAVAVKRLRICAQTLGAYGIRLGLEYVGPHHLRTRWKHPFIWEQKETLAFIDAIGEPNVGLLLDAYHWYTTGQSTAEIEKLEPHQIVHVHLNDARPVAAEEALDNDRLYPGEGVIPLADFLQALARTGYRGAVTQEVLTPHPPTATPDQLLRRSAEGIKKVLDSAGITHSIH